MEGNFTVVLTNENETPSITSNGGATASLSVAENQTAVTTLSEAIRMQSPYFLIRLSGGADQASFQVDGFTGVLTFLSVPDFENPTDAGANNGYDVTVQASDGSLHFEQTLTVTVTDVFENTGPSNLGANVLTISENEAIGMLVGSFVTTDPDAGATLTYSLVSGVGDETTRSLRARNERYAEDRGDLRLRIQCIDLFHGVQAKDEFNATVEGNFTVTLTDVYEPTP